MSTPKRETSTSDLRLLPLHGFADMATVNTEGGDFVVPQLPGFAVLVPLELEPAFQGGN